MKKPTLLKPVSKKPPIIKLAPEDLQEFTLRRATLNNANFQSLMVQEAYAQWAKNLRIKYDIPTAKFEIHPQTGMVIPKE